MKLVACVFRIEKSYTGARRKVRVLEGALCGVGAWAEGLDNNYRSASGRA